MGCSLQLVNLVTYYPTFYILKQIGIHVNGLERRVLKGDDPVCMAVMH